MFDFSKIKFDTFWREPQNRIYLDDMYEPLPNVPKDVLDSYNRYKNQIFNAKQKISKSVFKSIWYLRQFALKMELFVIFLILY